MCAEQLLIKIKSKNANKSLTFPFDENVRLIDADALDFYAI